MKTITFRLLAMIAFILVIGTLGLTARHYSSLDWIVENETRMRQFVRQQPWQGWLLGLAIYTAFSMVPGTAGKSMIAGWIFGFWPAVLMVDIGLTMAALGGFLVARFFVAEWVNVRFAGVVKRLDHLLQRNGAFYLVMLRLAHAPYSLVNYTAGATSVPCRLFCWTTALGILPGSMIFVFVGTRVPTLAKISEAGEHRALWQLFDPWLVGVLAATVVFPLLIRWAINKFGRSSKDELAVELSELESISVWSAPGKSNAAD